MEFERLNERLQAHFAQISKDRTIFETDADGDRLWEIYLNSFPEGTNPVYRTRREYDCGCCRHFIKDIGRALWIDEGNEKHSIFEFDAGDAAFQTVMDAMAAYVRTANITGPYYSKIGTCGTHHSTELRGETITRYSHFFLKLPESCVFSGRGTMGTAKAQFVATHDVFKRSLDEISADAIDAVDELIRSNTLYKGAEWAQVIGDFKARKAAYDAIEDVEKKANYCWREAATAGPVMGRIRNHSIGVLLVDISGGMELDEAVRRYEAIVAPANYKRPKAIFTKKMLEDAKKTVEEMGYMDSLPRRFATLDDITVNNILFSNRDAAKRMSGGVFDEMVAEAKKPAKPFSRAEEISIEKFVSDVLPAANAVEAYVEGRHAPNLVSLIAPVNRDAKPMFKWNNGFSWAYAGNMTDSDIRENVKAAGGRVDGDLRFSIQWNDGGDYDENDLDAHCLEPEGGDHIFFAHKCDFRTGGELDVDIIHPRRGKAAVENITFPDRFRMLYGEYRFFVHCYHSRGGRGGFRAEIEFDGRIYHYNYDRPMRQEEVVDVADVRKNADGSFSIVEKLPSETAGRTIWGIRTNEFTPVTVIMNSPNYWDGQDGIGHRHYMFMLKGCVNPEHPNGFYNEFLRNELMEHRRVFEALGSKMAVADSEDQLSGLGFSATKRNDLVVKVKGSVERTMRIKF